MISAYPARALTHSKINWDHISFDDSFFRKTDEIKFVCLSTMERTGSPSWKKKSIRTSQLKTASLSGNATEKR